MTTVRSAMCALTAVLALAGVARAQQEANELPEGIRQLIRATAQAEEQVKRENGVIVEDDAYQRYRAAKRLSRGAIRDYWTARFAFDRAYADADAARRDAAEADSHVQTLQNSAVPNPPQMQAAAVDRDNKLSSLATAEYYLEVARRDLEAARNVGGAAPAATGSRYSPTPAMPVPDNGTRQPGSVERSPLPEGARRFVYRNEKGSFHLLGRTGTASFSRGGRPQLVVLEFVKEREHFFFYRPQTADPSIVEWAFAKNPEFPAGGGEPKYAVWCHDRDGWHWEWTRREVPVEMPTPGPVPATSSVLSQPTDSITAPLGR